MQLEFIRFLASDGVQLQGWLSNTDGDTAVIHIHGMSGNGYENAFLDNLRDMYLAQGLAFFAMDNRGRGIISSFLQDGKLNAWGEGGKTGGSCFEIFEESVHDISGAINYLKTRGKKTFILQGHSLGCSKVVNFMVTQKPTNVAKVILLAPTDMTGWAQTDPKHTEYLAKAKELLEAKKGKELVGAECWLDKTPISAQTYPGICEAGGAVDIYGERQGGALLGKVTVPMLIPYGDEDIGIKEVDGTMEKWLERTNKIKNANTKIVVVEGASHGFGGYEEQLTTVVKSFLATM
jgi:alpha-beta hydrolase superfamily lysophospholipase